MKMAAACWCFYMSKFVELLDTVFFIFRKKFNQVTVLHVIHHGMLTLHHLQFYTIIIKSSLHLGLMPFSCWFGLRFAPGGMGTFYCVLNSFIHVLMYTYYGLSAFGKRFQKFLWWKRYMTQMQMVKF
jgi:elongation of very long chain fatty acids protein 7